MSSIHEKIYTVDQVARHLDLHPKTIRRYINEDRLQAHRVGGQWRISQTALNNFTGQETSAVTSDHQNQQKKEQKIEVSAIVDIKVSGSDEAVRIANTITAAMNSRGPGETPARCDHIYYESEKRARFIIFGSPKFVSTMLELLSTIS